MKSEHRYWQFAAFTRVRVQHAADEPPVPNVVPDASLRFTGTRHPLEHATGLPVPGSGASELLPGGFGPGKVNEADFDLIAGLRHAQIKVTSLPKDAGP